LLWLHFSHSGGKKYLVSINVTKATDFNQKIIGEVSKVVVGKDSIKEALMLALIVGGHVLIEGLPGTAKTTISKCFAQAIGGDFKRIQFTPDMMPADVTGFYLYSVDGHSSFIEGPIFANIVLADELNRTTPRTQSALLEAMQERQVTIERKTFPLVRPFMVIATQVQTGGEGTYALTDVQIDRFLLRIWSQYLNKEEERQVISNIDRIDQPDIQAVTSLQEVLEIQDLARQVHVTPDIADYIISIVTSLRSDADVLSGPSTRGSIALYRCARVLALLAGRDYVIPDDVKHLVDATLEHRIRVKPESEMDEVTPKLILDRTLERIPVPKFPL
jgi:MoxR-like ATPase